MKKILNGKLMLITVCGMLTSYAASAQGWVGNSNGKRLFAVNDSLSLTPLFVGIGTNAPAAQFHTTGTVRLAGITQNNTYTRILAQDTIGNVFWRDASTLGSGSSGWLLTGNTGTNPATNFLGTLDTARIVFRTNNVQKATILSNGNVGIGTNAPIKPLHIHNTAEDNSVFISGLAPSIYFNQLATQATSAPYTSPYARLGLVTRAGNFIATARIGDFAIHDITKGGSIVFGTGVDASGTNGVERARLDSVGNFGINTFFPSAKLHVNGTVRLQNLTAGSGKILVVNDSGYVFLSSTTSARVADTSTSALQEEVSALKQALADLQAQVAALKSGSLQVVTNNTAAESYVLASAPNPFSGSTTIKYAYPGTASKAFLTVTDLNGKPVKRFDLKANGGNSVTLTLDGSATAGTYIYALEVDGRVVESKKIVYNK